MDYILSYCFIKSGRVLRSFNMDLPLMPASNMKIVTAILAMRYIKDFKTFFKNENGNLVISGAPSTRMTREKFLELAGKSGKIKRIVFSDAYIDYNFYNNDWTYGNSEYCFQPKILPYIYNEGCDEPHLGRPLMNPLLEMSYDLGVTYTISPVHGESFILYRDNIKSLLGHMLYVSCNLAAEHISKYISYILTGTQGTWEKSCRIYSEFLNEKFPGRRFHVSDGSGLSRKNLISTYILASLINRDLADLMPAPGHGTLRNRLLNLHDIKITAKTGSLDGVSSLSGYIYDHDVSFSIIVNNAFDVYSERIVDETLLEILNKINII
ncbi:D-alanyl-D-alanine carboxypeptidase [Picrophilus oshimae]|uniref:D-Ala-D-Ala carboxypeptidase 3 n=1 Tax=Picrophilus torridus (strain ATCC 700027 / DSM 9790 / JCM 10055 / NBRC 100828 / KAW 2/3) TaxID=1122961 RepID=Q6L351_PICTO|nr:D-alanyl-D-alanine carboxypeptidase [Picrophilus oshimae]AAT42600.1 D-Ala-D-Ala carboxypeptidase 3 [Picrophilus oshimae DSM 9789]SMD31403.1 D-alanyl-D-alanine carboxypeptidase / D-alanyl-D-alanine-endopeptidase (penicillin-binding protein 4) [Picrophilus oshimae DSM 9789]